MAGGQDDKKKEQGKGFAGLSSLVSHVDTAPPPIANSPKARDQRPAEKHAAGETRNSTATTSSVSASAGRPDSQNPQSNPQPNATPPRPSSGSSGGVWVIIAVVIGALWLFGQADKKTPASAQTPAYSPPVQQRAAPSYSAPPAPARYASTSEDRPPVGHNLLFSVAQIRYCLAEDIRMDGAKAAVDNYSDPAVDRFNAMVADYNSRCSNYRYRTGTLESARQDIEPYRSQLWSQGRQRFAHY